jgi:hypothetical protein
MEWCDGEQMKMKNLIYRFLLAGWSILARMGIFCLIASIRLLEKEYQMVKIKWSFNRNLVHRFDCSIQRLRSLIARGPGERESIVILIVP